MTLKPFNSSTLKPLNPSPLKPLKKGWRWMRLGEVCEITMGQSPPGTSYNSNGRVIPLLNGPTEFGLINPTPVQWTTSPTQFAEPEDILLCVRGATTGRKNIADRRYCIGRGLAAIRGRVDKTLNRFLWFYLDTVTNSLLRETSGSTFPNLPREKLQGIEMLLPPLPEQKRIASILQELMQEVECARIACEKQLEAAKSLPVAYLREVFESEEAKKWERKKLGEVCEFLDNMRIPFNDAVRQERIAGKDQSELYPYYGANGQVGWIDDFLFDEELILLAEDGGFFGSTERPIAYKVSGKCWVNNHAHVLRAKNDLVDVDWLYFTLAIRPDIIQYVSGTTRPKLNQEKASLIPIPLPMLPIQRPFVSCLKEKMSQFENLQSAILNQQSVLHSLPQAILRKAFRGEL